MAKQAIKIDTKAILYFDNLPEENRLRYHNTLLTVSVLPENFKFINDPYSSMVTVSSEKTETTSLDV